MPLASLSGSITSAVGNHGIYAVFGLLVVAAVVPVASELVMLYAGAVAGGAFAGVAVHVFGTTVHSHVWGYVWMALAGMLGNVLGAAAGWALGTAYTHAHHDLRYADYAVGAGVVALAAYLLYRWVRAARVTRRADDPAR